MNEQRIKPVKGHSYDYGYVKDSSGLYLDFGCECGEAYGAQPSMSHKRARQAHREHLAIVAAAETAVAQPAEPRSEP